MGVNTVREYGLALALSAALVSAGCASEKASTGGSAEPPPVTARVIEVQKEPFTVSTPITGTLVSSVRVDVKAETTGRIVRFDKEEGALVAAGETVAWASDEGYQLALRQAETGVKVAEAALNRARLIERHNRSELERAQNLVKSGGITERDLKAAELAEHDARAQVSVATAQLDQAHAVLAVAGKHVRDAEIKSPVAGVLQKKFLNKGAYVEPPTAVFTVVDNGRLELESAVATADLAPIRPGQRVSFSVNSYTGLVFEGAVIEVNPSVDAETRSAKVRVRVPNPAGKLKAGMFAEGEILTGVIPDAVVIPADAVHRDDRSGEHPYVFVIEKGKAAKREIRAGRERGTRLEIGAGLRPGDRVIAEQNIQIAEGVRVQDRK